MREDDAGQQAPRVFISYSHDSPEHKDLVREFGTLLRAKLGFDVHLDQWYDDQRRDWAQWAISQLESADFVLAIASPAFHERADGRAPWNEGRGAQFEGAMMRDKLTQDQRTWIRKILPVVLPGGRAEDIPAMLFPYSATHFVISELTVKGVVDLHRTLAGVAPYPIPEQAEYVVPPSVNGGWSSRSLADYAAEVNRVCEFIPGKFDEVATAMSQLNEWSLADRRRLVPLLEDLHAALSTACTLVNAVELPSGQDDKDKVNAWRQGYLKLRDALGSTAHEMRREAGTRNLFKFLAYRIPADVGIYRTSTLLTSVRRTGQLIGITNCIP